jgi:hypothetical protein
MRNRRQRDPDRLHRDRVRAEARAAAGLPSTARKKRRHLGDRATPRRGTYRNRPLLELVRLQRCGFCDRRAPNSAHHFPGKGHLAGTDDRLACPACGDGVLGCHGRAQRYEISAEEQCAAVGRQLRLHLRGGHLTMADVDEALLRVPRHDWREIIRLAAAAE